jgi:CRP/FNR family transcriptional activator FtrB
MPFSDWDCVRAIPLFASMSEANFRVLCDSTVVHRFPKNATLLKEGERPRFLYVLVEGSVELFGSHDGQAATIEVREPVAALTLPSVVRATPTIKSVRTISPARLLAMPAEAVREAFRRDAAFSRAVAEQIAESYSEIVRLLMNEKLRTSTERLAAWIFTTFINQGNGRSFALKFNKRVLASRLGMAPENLSRNLAYLERFGVKNEGRDIIVKDLESLRQFAKPNVAIDGIGGFN